MRMHENFDSNEIQRYLCVTHMNKNLISIDWLIELSIVIEMGIVEGEGRWLGEMNDKREEAKRKTMTTVTLWRCLFRIVFIVTIIVIISQIIEFDHLSFALLEPFSHSFWVDIFGICIFICVC